MPAYLRAEAYRQQRARVDAVRTYERLIQHRGTDPYAPMVPLSWLGLARVRSATGETPASRTAYEMALSYWQAADDDFPPRRAAQEEYDALTGPSTAVAAPVTPGAGRRVP